MRHSIIIIFACVMLASCSSSDGVGGDDTHGLSSDVVSFATDVSTQTTRATTGNINNLDALKATPEGFGVFAYLTDGTQFNTTGFKDKDDATTRAFSDFFMQNQQVTWNNSYQDAGGTWHKDWVYSPLKYWPNSTNNATPRYISFFAYAPYATTGATTGVTNFTRSEDRTPHVIYKLGAADQQVDLLWANKIDATRNGQGLISAASDPLTYQKVPLEFHHALAAVDFYVQRVYDEPVYTGNKPDSEQNTKLFVSKLVLTSKAPASGQNALQKSGKLSLIDGTWEDDGSWVGTEDVTLTYDETMFVDSIHGTTDPREEYIRDAELDKWKKDTYGVTEKELYLFKDSLTQVFLPRKVTLIPTLTYSMVTRDDNLQLNYFTDSEGHRYTRVVNEVTGNSVTLDFVAGKRYTVLLRISAEHILFEVMSIVDWDFPMRYDPSVVTDYKDDQIGHIVNEE